MEVLTQWQSWIKAQHRSASRLTYPVIQCFPAQLLRLICLIPPLTQSPHPSVSSIAPHPVPLSPRQPHSHSHSLNLMIASDGSNYRPLYLLPHSSLSPLTIPHFFFVRFSPFFGTISGMRLFFPPSLQVLSFSCPSVFSLWFSSPPSISQSLIEHSEQRYISRRRCDKPEMMNLL